MPDYAATNVGEQNCVDVMVALGWTWRAGLASPTTTETLTLVLRDYDNLFRRLADA